LDGECTNEPRMRESRRGSDVVAGRLGGGLDIFYFIEWMSMKVTNVHVMAHQFKFCFSAISYANGLDTLLARLFVIESEESLVGLDTFFGIFFDDLEGEFEGIGGRKG
jgi:hypothetical protein